MMSYTTQLYLMTYVNYGVDVCNLWRTLYFFSGSPCVLPGLVTIHTLCTCGWWILVVSSLHECVVCSYNKVTTQRFGLSTVMVCYHIVPRAAATLNINLHASEHCETPINIVCFPLVLDSWVDSLMNSSVVGPFTYMILMWYNIYNGGILGHIYGVFSMWLELGIFHI